jgi:hypothetical protein
LLLPLLPHEAKARIDATTIALVASAVRRASMVNLLPKDHASPRARALEIQLKTSHSVVTRLTSARVGEPIRGRARALARLEM